MVEVHSETQENLISKDVIHHIEKLLQEQSIKNYTMEISPGSIKGDNYLGIIAKLDIHGEDANSLKKTINLIVKSASRTDFMRSFNLRDIFEREVFVYKEILPAFASFQAERNVEHPFSSVAKFYTSLINESNEVIVLENMKELGYKLWERRNPYDYNHAVLAVREYGKFHALSYALRDQKPELFQKLTQDLEDIFITNSMCSDVIADSFKKNHDKILACLDPDEDKIAYEKFSGFLENVIPIVKSSVCSIAAGKYSVIGHADCWINNLLYKYENEEKPLRPTKMCILDWQMVLLGSPIIDLSFLIFSSTDKKLRDNYYDDLLLDYYYSLSSHLVALGSDPTEVFPFDVFNEHLKTFSVYGLYMSMTSLMSSLTEPECIPDMDNDSVEMNDVINSFFPPVKSLEKYYDRLKGIVLDFVNYNYL